MTEAGRAMHDQALHIHASNIHGMGATRLVQALLPELESNHTGPKHITLPAYGELSGYAPRDALTSTTKIRRIGPKPLSRLLELAVEYPSGRTGVHLLTLGDIPLRTSATQTLFLHNPNLLSGTHPDSRRPTVSQAVQRLLLRRNLKWTTGVIVQTEAMRLAFRSDFPEYAGSVEVVPQPPPPELLQMIAHAPQREPMPLDSGLRLLYPSAYYPHKNHRLLVSAAQDASFKACVKSLSLTLTADDLGVAPSEDLPIISFEGQQEYRDILRLYRQADALVFPSLAESYGLPLVEAMFLGLPIVASDRAYARHLCGNDGMYFDPTSPGDLCDTLCRLHARLRNGWKPDWSAALAEIPTTWGAVARRMLDACEP